MPSLLYATETLTLYSRHIKKLGSIQMNHLRQVMNIKWQDRVANVQVLQRAGLPSIESMVTASQLRWAGHVRRMPEHRLPKMVFYGELSEGKRQQGGQILRYKDTLKRSLGKANIDVDRWESLASDRISWRLAVRNTIKTVEDRRNEMYKRQHDLRHGAVDSFTSDYQCITCRRNFRSNAGLSSHKRARKC